MMGGTTACESCKVSSDPVWKAALLLSSGLPMAMFDGSISGASAFFDRRLVSELLESVDQLVK